ncbi:WD40 repeat domain-containing protein [Aliinostoc sp. HNIBRCY26]|uniref:WD40 repeat domain-containing protein n=1 Tax=Aliinostoc sp. HNIBRCY26 TaxID=3418997 RepID=UPI003D076AD6
MVSLRLGQLIHTSFPVVGFRTVVSGGITPEIQQAFLEQIVYQYWDSYEPPSPGYRAAYLHQLNPEQSLFGWLYNDGLDDFGRNDVPFFICYYLAGKLQPIQLENILICLCTGPVRLINRNNFPECIDSLVIPDLWSYQPARIGVKIPQAIIDKSRVSFEHDELIKLFVFTVEEKIQDSAIADEHLLAVSINQKPDSLFCVHDSFHNAISPPETINTSLKDLSISLPSAEEYQQILLSKTRLKDIPKPIVISPLKSNFLLGIILSNLLILTLILLGYYIWKAAPANHPVPQNPEAFLHFNQSSNTQNQIAVKTLNGHADAVWSVVLTKNGQTLVSASADQTIKVWNLNTGKVVRTLSGHSNIVRAIALSADEKTLVSGGGDSTIKVWNFQTLELMRTITLDPVPVWSLAISNDGQILVSGNGDGTIKAWNLHTGKLLHTFVGHRGRVFSVAMSPDGKTFATGGIDKTVKIWDLQTGKLVKEIPKHEDAVRAVIFSRDGQTLASASWDQTIKLWNVQTGELLHTLTGHNARVVTLALGFDHQTLVSGSLDNTIKIWDMPTGKLLHTLSGHSDWVLAIATNPAKQIITSSSRDKTIRIWQLDTQNHR